MCFALPIELLIRTHIQLEICSSSEYCLASRFDVAILSINLIWVHRDENQLSLRLGKT